MTISKAKKIKTEFIPENAGLWENMKKHLASVFSNEKGAKLFEKSTIKR